MKNRPQSLRLIVFVFAGAFMLLAAPIVCAQPAHAATQVIERGKFRFFDTKQPQGEESYEITNANDTIVVRSQLELTSEQKISLTAALTLRTDLTPMAFEIKGTMPSGVKTDSGVDIQGQIAVVREGNQTTRMTLPARFFAISSYAPIAVEMMLIRYWSRHRFNGPFRIFPNGEVSIEHLGRDVVTIDGKKMRLDCYSLAGLTWGRQTLWMDSKGGLIAVVGIGSDIEATLPVVRDGLESALPYFLKRAAEVAVQQLTVTASRLSPLRSTPLAIVGGTLIDGTGSAPVADSVVVIDGGRIISAGTRSQVRIPKGARVLDAQGKYLLPGLWDMHAHFFKAEFGPAYLAAGITTVRDVGNEFEFVTTLRDASREGRGLGPSMLLAGYIEGKNDQHSFDIQVDTPEEARVAVRRYKDAGFEQIKIRDHLKPDILKVIADEAHRLGMTLTGHVPGAMNVLQAVEAGQDQISHINFVAPVFDFKRNPTGPGFVVDPDSPKTKQAIELFKQHGTVFDPTLAYMEMFVRAKATPITTFEPGFAKLPKEYSAHLDQQKRQVPPAALLSFLSVVGALHHAGIPVVAGTDVVVPAHSVHRELELFVRAGFTPMEAIQSATIVPAQAMKLDKEVGTVEKGKRADLIIVDADPLQSIGNIRKVRAVVRSGRLFDCAQLWQAAGFKP
ncbi:MAG TPA: amidohydrolase family protein [Blastocatellia bacterium]|nr:amidohydrolase family protein [Blastocatellia bacterium]